MPYPPWMRTGSEPSPAQTARRSLRARWFAAALSAFVQLPGLAFALAGVAHVHHLRSDAFAVACVLAGLGAAVLLLLPWRGPRVVAVAVVALPAIAFAPGPPLAALAVAFAVGDAVLRGAGVWAWSTLIGVGVTGASAILIRGASAGGIRVLIVTIILCIIAGATTGAGARRERFHAAAREETSRRRSAAEEERLRIARELHDVLAHSLSQISVQAGVGLHLFEAEPERAKESLRSIRETSTTALDEVRSVLGILREPGASPAPRSPGPSLEAIPALMDEVRSAGLVVHAEGLEGLASSDIPLAVQSAAYRIVQESLTNIRRHAPGSDAMLRLSVATDAVRIVIENGPPRAEEAAIVPGAGEGAALHAGQAAAAGTAHREGGRGVLGMTERAAALGGTLTAQQRSDGGFVVTAVLPVRARGWRR